MSEQLHDISVSEMDLTMQEFVKLIRATKSHFGTKIPEMVQNYTKTVILFIIATLRFFTMTARTTSLKLKKQTI